VNREQPEHAIRAACEVSKDEELYVFGSQAILGEYPQAPEVLRASIEVDMQPKNRPEAVDLIDGALGEISAFHQTHGFYVHGVSIESADLPDGWESRTVPVCDLVGTRGGTGHCLEAHDLAASKLSAYREKDLDFVTLLLQERLIDPLVLLERINALPIKVEKKERLAGWLAAISRALGLADSGPQRLAPPTRPSP
jgi:hypothetical protein